MSNENITPVAEVYVVITYSIFGGIETTEAFYSQDDAEQCVIEWANKNCPFMKTFTSSDEAISWFSEHEEDIDISIALKSTEIHGNKAYLDDDYAMLVSENKLMAEFLTNLGYTNEQISEIANTGKLNVNVIQEPDDRELKQKIGSLGYDLATLMLEANDKLSENSLIGDSSVLCDDMKREKMIEEMVVKDIESIIESYQEYKDTSFLCSVLCGDGFTQYNNLTDAQVLDNYNDRLNYWTEDEDSRTEQPIKTLEDAKALIGESVNVLDNNETHGFFGYVTEVNENDIDGILVSVIDSDEAVWDIELQYIRQLDVEDTQWCDSCKMDVAFDEIENCVHCGMPV